MMTQINWSGDETPAVPDKVLDAMPKRRVFTYTRTYRIETTLTDEELIKYVNEDDDSEFGFVHNAETVIDAFDALVDEHECGVKMDKTDVQLHNTKFEEADPGFF
jgi:hypothetical protein